jgi:hypothetical protein
MGLVFHRRLAIPLWAIAFFTVALTAPTPATLFLMPPATLFVVAVFGIAAVIFTMPGVVPRLRPSRSATCVRTLDEPNERTADDALDLVRTDDDGAWQRARPPG